MRIARPRERCFFGDRSRIRDVVDRLRLDAPTKPVRIVVSGVAGVGKDTFVAECLGESDFSKLDGWLQGWIVATSRGSFEQTLFELFRGRWAGVVEGCEKDRVKALENIREWLAISGFVIGCCRRRSRPFASPKDKGKVPVEERRRRWERTSRSRPFQRTCVETRSDGRARSLANLCPRMSSRRDSRVLRTRTP